MPELGSINMGPGTGQDGMNPADILNQQAQQELSKLDKEWSDKYQQLNKQYDWSRHEKRPDEITRLRGRLEQDIAGRRQAIQSGFGSALSKFKMLDELFEHDPQQANKLKWTTIVGKQTADAMFPGQRDPRLEHQRNLSAQGRALDTVEAYVIEGGKLYHSKVDDKNRFTGVANRGEPAEQDEVRLWAMSKDALGTLEQEELGILGQLSDAGMPDPAYLQGLFTGQRRKSWFKRFMEGFESGRAPAFGGGIKGLGTFATEPKGTFAQKVTETLPQQPQRRQPKRKLSRQELLTEYNRLGGSQTPEGRTFADKNLR